MEPLPLNDPQTILAAATLAVICLVVALVVWLIIRGKRKHAERERLAFTRGWNYRRKPERGVSFRIEGADGRGRPWKLEAITSVNNKNRRTNGTVIKYPDTIPPAGDVVMIGRRPPLPFNLDLGDKVLRSVLLQAWGSEAQDFMDVQEADAGGAELREQYLVLADNEQALAKVLTSGLEAKLTEFAGRHAKGYVGPVVMWWKDGLTVWIAGAGHDFDMIEELAQLGEAAVAGIK